MEFCWLGLVLIALGVLGRSPENCGKKNVDCMSSKDGVGYTGTMSKTKGGYTCQRWDLNTPHSKSSKTGYQHNYCRNPDGMETLWCYTTSPDKRWDYCSVRECGDCDTVDCGIIDIDCYDDDKKDYQGPVATTKRGYECQRWDTNTPHSCSGGCGEKHNHCRNVGEGTPWCYTTSPDKRWDTCTPRKCEKCDKFNPQLKKDYLALNKDDEKNYLKEVRRLLPQLLAENLLAPGEVGIAKTVTDPKSDYGPLALLTGDDIVTLRPENKVLSINGTVTKKVGKRSYSGAKYRPTGLFAPPGDLITLTIPKKLVGKIGVRLGQDNDYKLRFNKLTKETQKIGSPYGGLIIIYLTDIDATTEAGMFEVTVDNAVQAPYFVYGENTNEDWNKIKHYASPFSVLRFPGRIHIYIQTEYVKGVTDMVKVLKSFERSFDIVDEMIGIPTDLQPGEEQLHYDPAWGGGGFRSGVCEGGRKSAATAQSYWKRFIGGGSTGVVYHEWGHGFCNDDLPDMGSQMYADLIREYVSQVRAAENDKKDYEAFKEELDWKAGYGDPFTILHSLVAFKTFSNGKSCVAADAANKFPSGISYYLDSYMSCWTQLYRLPLYEFGWDVLKQVLQADALSTTKYKSKTDNMADQFCKATKSNMIPLFNFFNIEVSPEVANPCKEQKEAQNITNYIKVANCIMEKDIMECVKMPEFPEYKGICRFTGVCNKNPDQGNRKTTMENVFDQWGSATHKDYKPGYRDTTGSERNCHKRAEEVFKQCGNTDSQAVTASFTLKDGVSTSSSFPPVGSCGKKNVDCLTSKDGKDYTGTISKTKSGFTCQRWDSQSPQRHSVGTEFKHNYCRNPDGEPTVWCYTTSGKRWETCDVPRCRDCATTK